MISVNEWAGNDLPSREGFCTTMVLNPSTEGREHRGPGYSRTTESVSFVSSIVVSSQY
jgi:hypothetical protein